METALFVCMALKPITLHSSFEAGFDLPQRGLGKKSETENTIVEDLTVKPIKPSSPGDQELMSFLSCGALGGDPASGQGVGCTNILGNERLNEAPQSCLKDAFVFTPAAWRGSVAPFGTQ